MQSRILRLFLGLFFTLLAALPARATHIVGGELELVHLSDNTYRAGLIMYFDAIYGNPGAIDPNVTVHIFSKSNDAFVTSITMRLRSDNLVSYSQPDCAIGELVTRRIYYWRNIELNPFAYNDPEGYYMIWERCCRNGVIDNIIAPGDAGQTFYMEFPPLSRNGARFINSSPELFPPLSDYACVNQPFNFDFSGSDKDGDDLRYSLSVPLNGYSTAADPVPPAFPAPYPPVTFLGGLGLNNMIPGSPSLRINSQGILTLTPTQPGLFVFAVKVEEFRNGVKIGELRREYQLLVIDCPTYTPPNATAETEAEGEYREGTILELDENDPRCGTIFVTDGDDDAIVQAEVIPVQNGEGIIIDGEPYPVPGRTGEAAIPFCLPECPPVVGEPIIFDILVSDNACAVPLYDTLRMRVLINVPENLPPTVTTDLAPPANDGDCFTDTLLIGENFNFNVISDDPNSDTVSVEMIGMGFSPEGVGMSLTNTIGPAELISPFSWTPPCDLLEDDEEERLFELLFVTQDSNKCNEAEFDTTCVNLLVTNKVEANFTPELTTDLVEYDPAEDVYIDSVIVGNDWEFTLFGFDADSDSIALTGFGLDFQFADHQITFSDTAGRFRLEAPFLWETECDDLEDITEPRTFNLRFILNDFKTCDLKSYDTLDVRMTLLPLPESNTTPEISIPLAFDSLLGVYVDTVIVGDSLTFPVWVTDAEDDSVMLWAEGEGFGLGEYNMVFNDTSGIPIPRLESWFRWQTLCEYLGVQPDEVFQREFLVNFYAKDFKDCQEEKTDSVQVLIRLRYLDQPNQPPTVTVPLDFDPVENVYFRTVTAGELVQFDVTGDDPDRTPIFLEAQGVGFNLPDFNMSFPEDLYGIAPVTGTFEWPSECAFLNPGFEDRSFYVDFIVTDITNCEILSSDTVRVRLDLTPDPENTPPTLDIEGLTFDAGNNVYRAELFVNQTIDFMLVGNDAEGDNLTISGEGQGFTFTDVNFQFQTTTGAPELRAPASWTPTCDLLGGQPEREFPMTFLIQDETPCGLSDGQSVDVILTVRDYNEVPDYRPPNVFTPNDDGKNDTFRMPNLPPNTCSNEFEKIEIYNRWGRLVFESQVRDFEWDGADFPDGVYFFQLKFQRNTYKGSVTLIRAD